MSWESLEQITDRSKEQEKAQELATLYFTCFNTEAGRLVIDNLVEVFMTKPIVRSGEDAYAQGIRQGRYDVVSQIIQQVEYAKNPTNYEPRKSLAQILKKALLKNI
jgi:hypothetical protein